MEDLRAPPGNRLERLKDDRAGRYSIRINNQWRICFTGLEVTKDLLGERLETEVHAFA